jgi:cytochrome P450
VASALTIAARREFRWLVMHRGTRTMSVRQARKGMPVARLMFEPGARMDPYPLFEEIRAAGRIVPTPIMHATVDHAIVSGALRDSQNFGVAFGDAEGTPAIIRFAFRAPDPNVASVVDAPSLLSVDPPTHTRYRRLVTKPFTPRALQQVADNVESRAARLLDGRAGRRTVDIVAAYANLLPVAVIAEILGVPENMHEQFLRWGHAAAPVLDLGLRHREYVAVNRSLKAMNDWFDQHFANLRRKPGDDILSQLVNADPADRLTDLELRATAMLLLGAGFETTVNLLGSGVAVIAADEKSRARLTREPDLWAQAVDELLRFESPVQITGRVALADTEIDGVAIAKGTPLLCLLGGANRDPAVFANPGVFDLDRPNSREHVSFSAGIHYCLGANLAKMEGQTGLRLLFERYPDLQLVPGGGKRRDLQSLRGYESLLVDLHDS